MLLRPSLLAAKPAGGGGGEIDMITEDAADMITEDDNQMVAE